MMGQADQEAAGGVERLRAGESVVIRHGLQHRAVIGPVLQWLGPRLP